jgi:hypothetical protein
MLSTKIRTTIATLAATLSVGVAMVPLAQAATNSGGFQRSSEAQNQKYCDYVWGQFENSVNQADAANNAGDTQSRDKWLDEARNYVNNASAAGCDWAAKVAVPTSGTVSAAPAVGSLAP